MTGIRLDGVQIPIMEDMGMYIDLSEGWTWLRLSILVSSRRRSLKFLFTSFTTLSVSKLSYKR